MARTAAFWAAPSALLAWSWLRLSQPHAAASTALWLIALALAPALLPRPRQRVLALVPASVLALHVALGVWLVHPLRLLGRFGGGFLVGRRQRPGPPLAGLGLLHETGEAGWGWIRLEFELHGPALPEEGHPAPDDQSAEQADVLARDDARCVRRPQLAREERSGGPADSDRRP